MYFSIGHFYAVTDWRKEVTITAKQILDSNKVKLILFLSFLAAIQSNQYDLGLLWLSQNIIIQLLGGFVGLVVVSLQGHNSTANLIIL